MKQSSFHVAIIMDGNGRWATTRGRFRGVGHRAGARAVRRTVENAPAVGITVLTLYAFSSDNWQRPPEEVQGLMRLFEAYLRGETARCVAEGVRVRVVGRRDRLPDSLLCAIDATENATASGTVLQLNIAVDYSSRHAITAGDRLPDVDLMIRTGGEKRLSDFLLWESAYAELHFTDRQWPDYGREDLEAAVNDFRSRDRRFGGLPALAVDPSSATPIAEPLPSAASASATARVRGRASGS
jgi:undecaprenyl diphosphate synthase